MSRHVGECTSWKSEPSLARVDISERVVKTDRIAPKERVAEQESIVLQKRTSDPESIAPRERVVRVESTVIHKREKYMKHKITVSDQCYREIREKLLAVGDGHLLQDSTIYREIDVGRVIIRNEVFYQSAIKKPMNIFHRQIRERGNHHDHVS